MAAAESFPLPLPLWPLALPSPFPLPLCAVVAAEERLPDPGAPIEHSVIGCPTPPHRWHACMRSALGQVAGPQTPCRMLPLQWPRLKRAQISNFPEALLECVSGPAPVPAGGVDVAVVLLPLMDGRPGVRAGRREEDAWLHQVRRSRPRLPQWVHRLLWLRPRW